MAFQLKYYYSYKSIGEQQYTVKIFEDSAEVLTAVEIVASTEPFVVESPEIDTKFITVRGAGATLNLISQPDRQFLNLYTADIQQYKVQHYIGSALIWAGYLDSELYSESFNELDNYPVSFSANDGLNILDRINYVDADGNKYGGIVSQWTVLTNILSKLGLEYNNIFIGLSTTIDGVTLLSSETILHRQYVIQENYINEDDEPETCRTVVEAILAPYGAYIEQKNGNLYITDVNHLAQDTTIQFKKFNSSTYAYISTDTIDQNLGDLTTIKFSESNQELDTVGGINKQVVSYSPYNNEEIIDYSPDDDFSNESSNNAFGSGLYEWKETYYNDSEIWNKYNLGYFCKGESTAGSTEGDSKFYLKIGREPVFNVNWVESRRNFSTKKQLPYIIPSSGFYLKIEINANFRTKSDWENSEEEGNEITRAVLLLRIRIGTKVFVSSDGWRDESASTIDGTELNFYNITDVQYNNSTPVNVYGAINDTDITAENQKIFKDKSIKSTPVLIPLDSGFSGGVLEFDIYNWMTGGGSEFTTQVDEATTNATLDCRINSVYLNVTDADGNEISSDDIEYVADYKNSGINNKFKDEGDKVSLIHGTNYRGISTERAGILGHNGTNYYFLQSWTREGESDKLERLLLRSIVSNYKNQSIKLTCKINMISSLFGYLTYSSFLSGIKFMITSYTINYADDDIDVTLVEFYKDNLTIN